MKTKEAKQTESRRNMIKKGAVALATLPLLGATKAKEIGKKERIDFEKCPYELGDMVEYRFPRTGWPKSIIGEIVEIQYSVVGKTHEYKKEGMYISIYITYSHVNKDGITQKGGVQFSPMPWVPQDIIRKVGHNEEI